MSDASPPSQGRRRRQRSTSLFALGEPMIWLTGGALVIALVMILGLLWVVFDRGLATFWPRPIESVTILGGVTLMGEVAKEDRYQPDKRKIRELPPELRDRAKAELAASADGRLYRTQLRTGNFDLTNTHFTWVNEFQVESREEPEWAVIVERLSWGRFYGWPTAFIQRVQKEDGSTEEVVVAEGAEASWAMFKEKHDDVRRLWEDRCDIERHELGDVNRKKHEAALDVRRVELDPQATEDELAEVRVEQSRIDAWASEASATLRVRIDEMSERGRQWVLRFGTTSGTDADIFVEEIVRAYPANQLGWGGKMSVYVSRWWEFVTDDPREANSEGGVWPAIFGTVIMTLLMSIVVVPFGVLAALYLREYAKAGPVVSTVRVAINNLAGVPSIVFGVFGLGFFCYVLGVRIDELFFPEYSPAPKYGTGGILWASITLALLTLPVVIVATEEALAAVPGSMREGSYACGASKWQTIKRIVLPRALPGIMTGMILAVARGAGEVAPLMLVGAVKMAPDLPLDGVAPFIHPERSFMHLGFHIYDLGFQSQNSEAAKPLVFSTTLLLILIVIALNALGMVVRARLRRKFAVGV